MSRSPGRLRAKALVLFLVLLVGGFGLPIVDALWFHSTSTATVSTEVGVGGTHGSSTSHLLGCAVWSSPATSTGLPCVPAAPSVESAQAAQPQSPELPVLANQDLHKLALPRAPPSA